MAKARKTTKKSSGGRGSAEAIEKRRVARQLNALLAGGAKDNQLDGRTELRRKRLIKELVEGRKGQPLKAIDFLLAVNDLLDIGESVASLKKQGVKARKIDVSEEVLQTIQRTQSAYGFRPETWKLLGLSVGGEERSVEPTAPRGARKTRKPRKKS